MNVIVTGGAGFVGTNLVKKLFDRNINFKYVIRNHVYP